VHRIDQLNKINNGLINEICDKNSNCGEFNNVTNEEESDKELLVDAEEFEFEETERDEEFKGEAVGNG